MNVEVRRDLLSSSLIEQGSSGDAHSAWMSCWARRLYAADSSDAAHTARGPHRRLGSIIVDLSTFLYIVFQAICDAYVEEPPRPVTIPSCDLGLRSARGWLEVLKPGMFWPSAASKLSALLASIVGGLAVAWSLRRESDWRLALLSWRARHATFDPLPPLSPALRWPPSLGASASPVAPP